MAFEVNNLDEVGRLEAYETDRYRNASCIIYLKGHEGEMRGRTLI
jgi:hypothetical protein